MKAAVIILNWNGEKLLQDFLPSVIKNTNPALGKVVVADNASTDRSLEVMRAQFPEVEVVVLDKNYGFAGGYNRVIAGREEDVVVLLNSDVEVAEGWLEPLLEALEREERLVAVQPKIKSYRDKDYFEYAGACGGFLDYLGFPFCRGRILNDVEKDEGQYDDEREVFWCSGAALCIRRRAYLDAGGLDERFFAHMEEIDLCWRLRNQGAVLKVCPRSVVYHLGGGSLPMNHPRKLFLNYRNNWLMLYKNLSPKAWRRIIWRRRLLDLAKKDLDMFPARLEDCMQPNMQQPTRIHPARMKFEQLYARKGFLAAMKRYGDVGWRYKLAKPFLTLLSSETKLRLKRLIYRI